MSVKLAVREILLADAGVAALVETRVYPRKLPQGVARPAIIYMSVTSGPANVLAGEQDASRTLIQITASANDEATATAVKKAACRALREARKTTVDGVTFDAVWVVDERDLPAIPSGAGNDVATYSIAVDFSIHHRPLE